MLLAVDTSTAQVGIALYDGSQVVAEFAWRSSRRHTVELAPAVADMLKRCDLTMEDIRVLAVARGPGSFTSLRVGLSLMKGLALARSLPLIGVHTLDILAAAQPSSRLPLIIAIQAGRGRLAVGWYRRSKYGWQARGAPRVLPVEELIEEAKRPAIVCGELTAAQRQKVLSQANLHLASPAQSVRRPGVLAELAWKRWQAGDVDDEATLAPIYLHVAEPIPV